ncbi:MAG: outer membrane protein insertion porin family, partial [Hyphomicrobiales bacterium]|nr:outer membrane protein insertion porin family [Hyphomicrobiales bacterium]
MRRWLARIMIAGYVALGWTPMAARAANGGILVAGNVHIGADTIRSYFPAGTKNGLDPADLDAGLKALYATQLFADVRISHRDGQTLVTVVENPSIARVAFEGNSKVKDEDLRKIVESKERGPLSRPLVQSDVARIVDLYHHHARFDVHVDPKIIEAKDRRVNLVFEIREGARTGVRQILFMGNNAYSATQLRGVIKTGQTNVLSSLLDNDLYDADQIEADRDLLRRFYSARGYADARTVSTAAQYDPAKKGFVVTFTINEGARYRIGKADIASDIAGVDANALRSNLTTHAGDIYNADTIEKTVAGLSTRIAAHGEAFANIRVQTDRIPGRDTIDLRYVVEQGPRVYVERIEIHGNMKTRDHVIRREFDLAEGDAYNATLVTRAERRLKNLGFFKTVNVSKKPGST